MMLDRSTDGQHRQAGMQKGQHRRVGVEQLTFELLELVLPEWPEAPQGLFLLY